MPTESPCTAASAPRRRPATPRALLPLLLWLAVLGGCSTPSGFEAAADEGDEPEPTFVAEEPAAAAPGDDESATTTPAEAAVKDSNDELTAPAPPAAPESTPAAPESTPGARGVAGRGSSGLDEVVIATQADDRHDVIRDLVVEARSLLREVPLSYVFTGKGRRETLRGRPVAFALWSESSQSWSVAHVEIPRPPVRWRPGGKPLAFVLRAPPGVTARHIKGTGAERLMFSFARDGEPLKVYGRKFPVFDNRLLAQRRWRAVAATAKPIVYLPFTADTLDPRFVAEGREFLRQTATQAIEDLRRARVPSMAYPGELLADLVPPEVIMTLAVIEQTDDTEFRSKGAQAFEEVLSHYGLKREEAYRYSISRARAIGPMQFTNRRGNGTYALVVRRCPGARIDPDFERGATDLRNAMRAAICLFDIELRQMSAEIRRSYRDNKAVLGIFPVAAYNGGPRNVARLSRVLQRMGVEPDELRAPGVLPQDSPVSCPCVWRDGAEGVQPLGIPRYNEENRWYIEKYQRILGSLAEAP